MKYLANTLCTSRGFNVEELLELKFDVGANNFYVFGVATNL